VPYILACSVNCVGKIKSLVTLKYMLLVITFFKKILWLFDLITGMASLNGVSLSHSSDTQFSVGLLWMVISSTQRPLPDKTQQLQDTDLHVLGGIRTRNRSKRAVADSRLRPRGHRNRHDFYHIIRFLKLPLLEAFWLRMFGSTTPGLICCAA